MRASEEERDYGDGSSSMTTNDFEYNLPSLPEGVFAYKYPGDLPDYGASEMMPRGTFNLHADTPPANTGRGRG
jgi:hypothetical protein